MKRGATHVTITPRCRPQEQPWGSSRKSKLLIPSLTDRGRDYQLLVLGQVLDHVLCLGFDVLASKVLEAASLALCYATFVLKDMPISLDGAHQRVEADVEHLVAVGDIEVVVGLEVLGNFKGNHVTMGDVGFVQMLVGLALLHAPFGEKTEVALMEVYSVELAVVDAYWGCGDQSRKGSGREEKELHGGLNVAEALVVDEVSWEAFRGLDKCWILLGGLMALYIQAVRKD